ncbi:MAG: hypothetical protein Q8K57_09760, partial [Thiobacillus sp.]|nr:hypothetical protein [Thiobacillus sp.]
TSCSQSRRATGLRYTPKSCNAILLHFGEARLYMGKVGVVNFSLSKVVGFRENHLFASGWIE